MTTSAMAPPACTSTGPDTGKVIRSLHSRHRAHEFLAFLKMIDAAVSADLDCHVVLDNASTHKTPAVKRWLTNHPLFLLHFAPTSSSWLNLVERWFAELTTNKTAPRHPHLATPTQRRHPHLDST